MDIQGEDSFGLSRENNLLFRHNPVHHMYFNDFTVPSSKALKELEDIDALSKHVIMKGLNEDEPSSPPSSLTPPPRHNNGLDYTTEPSLKLEEDDELGSTFAFFRKPGTHSSLSSLSHSVDDLLPQQTSLPPPHHSNGRQHQQQQQQQQQQHDFTFLQNPFDLRGSKPKDNSHTNGMHSPFSTMNSHDGSSSTTPKNSDSALISSMPGAPGPTIINNINHINNISTISTINNINNISNLNTYNTIHNINNNINNINISININSTDPSHPSKGDDLNDTSMDDKSAIHLINGSTSSSLEFLDDYITTGSNSSSSPEDLDDGGGGGGGGLGDSTASLSHALTTALTPAALSNSSTVLMSPAAAIPPPSLRPPLISHPLSHPLPLSHSPLSHSTPIPHPSVSLNNHSPTSINRLHHSTSSLLPPTSLPPSSLPSSSSVGGNGVMVPSNESSYSNGMVIKDGENGNGATDPNTLLSLAPGGTTVIDGVTYNNRGYEVCGSLNKFNKPCQRIGRCPFHHDSSSPKKSTSVDGANGTNAPAPERRYLPIKKGPYKSGWKKDEHIRFLKGLQMHGKGSWKEIALIVGTRTPTQIQVHAHRYYLRQQQETKNKRSIHDISLQDLEELEAHGTVMPSSDSSNSSPHLSPPSPDRSADLSNLFCSPSPHHPPHRTPTSPSLSTPTHPNGTNTSHITPLSPNPLSHSDSIPPPSTSSSPPVSAPSSPIVPPISSSSFPPLFSGSSTTSNTLPGIPLLSFPLAPLNYHNSSWYPPPTYMTQMSNLNSMTINMSSLGDVDLHLPSAAPSFSHMSDDDYDDDLSHHPHPPPTHHSDPSSPEEEFPSDDE